MTRFLDVRLRPVGGDLATTVAVFQGTSLANYTELPLAQLIADVRGKHVLLVTHGFNVDREAGIARLSNWEGLLQLPLISFSWACCGPGTQSGLTALTILKSRELRTTQART